MTNEEAIKELSVLWERMKRAKESGVLAYKTIMYYDGQYVEALDLAIKALGSWEKFSDKVWKRAYARGYDDAKTYMLDKIKAEIKELADYDNVDVLVEVVRIIDKYKSESKIEQALAYADQDTLMPAT